MRNSREGGGGGERGVDLKREARERGEFSELKVPIIKRRGLSKEKKLCIFIFPIVIVMSFNVFVPMLRDKDDNNDGCKTEPPCPNPRAHPLML